MQIPQHGQHPARDQNAGGFTRRGVCVDPMPRLRVEHRVDLPGGQREALATSLTHVDIGQRLSQNTPHLIVGLDGDHVEATSEKLHGELAGPGASATRRAPAGRPASTAAVG